VDESSPALIGLLGPSIGPIEFPRETALSGMLTRVRAANAWQRLTYRATLGSSSEPNRVVAHTLRLDGAGSTRVLTASLPVNQVTLSRSTLEAWPAEPAVGASVAYTLTLEAAGDVAARGVEARIDLPDSLALAQEQLPASLVYEEATHSLRWRGNLALGSPTALSWRAVIDPAVEIGGRIVTRALIRASGIETVERRQALRVDASRFRASRQRVSRRVAWPGQVISFVLQVANASPQASAVTVTDALPDGLELRPATLRASVGSAPDWDEASRSLHWSGEVPAGSRVDLRFDAAFVAIGPVVNVMRLTDAHGLVVADWVEIWPALARLQLPWIGR
jgi:uncharacterized repeat protein (TIGR01451 family)